MTQSDSNNPISDAAFWRAERDQYTVDPAQRDKANGTVYYPVPESLATCWVIVREVQDDGDHHELPAPVLVGTFDDREIADRICQLVISTANLGAKS